MSSESINEAVKIYGERYSPERTLGDARVILLGDGSSSAPNARASEAIISGVMGGRLEAKILTNIYPGASIGHSIDNSPYEVAVAIPKDLDSEYEQRKPDLWTLNLVDELVEINYVTLFDDPRSRVENILRRAVLKGTSREEALVKARRYLMSLPASVFGCECRNLSYLEAVVEDRRLGNQAILELMNNDGEIEVSNAYEAYEKITLHDVVGNGSEFNNRVAFTWECPACNLATDGGEVVKHVINFQGVLYKNAGSMGNGLVPPKCEPMRELIDKKIDLAETSMGQLMLAGFRPSGKLIYLTESVIYQNPGVVQAIRDYSDPRGTVEMAIREWSGLDVVTPRIYVYKNGEGGERDATLYELLEEVSMGKTQSLEEFVELLPMVSDGRKYVLNISKHTIRIE